MRTIALFILCAVAAGCARGPGEVADKVMQDFGLKDRPEGYQSGADRVFAKLNEVGKNELQRLNQQNRHGEVKFQDEEGIHGKFYKEVKVYENYYPLDAQPTPRSAAGDRGYIGYIEYSYRIYQSPRRSNRTEAAAEAATIPTDEEGRETRKYRFSSGGQWLGGEGETVDR